MRVDKHIIAESLVDQRLVLSWHVASFPDGLAMLGAIAAFRFLFS
jgi:hypothetical protein